LIGSNSWKFEFLSLNEALSLSAWTSAASAATSVWQGPGPFEAWSTHIAPLLRQRAVVSIATDPSGTVLLLPLLARSWRAVPVMTITPIGGATHCDYHDPVEVQRGTAPPSMNAYWAGLTAAVHKLGHGFNEFGAYRITARFAPDNARLSGSGHIVELSPFRDMDSFLATRKPKLRSHVARKLRRASELGLQFRRFDSASDIGPFIHQLSADSVARWGRPFVREDHLIAYWTQLARWALREGCLEMSELKIGDLVVHRHLGFRHNSSILWYKIAFPHAAAQWSPGSLHLAQVIADASARGIQSIDLGFGDEPYKAGWETATLPLYQVDNVPSPLRTMHAIERSTRRARFAVARRVRMR